MRPGSMNGWNYAEGDPVNFSDPTGKQIIPLGCLEWAISPELIPPWVTAEYAVNACRRFWSKETVTTMLGPNGCNYDWSPAQSAVELLWDFMCEQGTTYAIFYGQDRLTNELASSAELHQIRSRFYENGNIPLHLEEFNVPEFALATFDAFRYLDLPITHFLASFDIKVTGSVDRVHFLVHNKTDLSSATHFRGHFETGGYNTTVEDLIEGNRALGSRSLREIFDQYKVISILRERNVHETDKQGGATHHQLFTWSERRFDCWPPLPWPTYLLFLDIGEYGLPIEYDTSLIQ